MKMTHRLILDTPKTFDNEIRIEFSRGLLIIVRNVPITVYRTGCVVQGNSLILIQLYMMVCMFSRK